MTQRIDPATLPGRPCSLAAALELVGDRWSLLIVREVLFGNRRFSQIARNTGAPRDRLAARLRSLVDGGILERRAYQETPRREEYLLTDAGRDLAPMITALLDLGRQMGRHRTADAPASPRSRARAGHLVRRLRANACGGTM